MTSRLLSGLTCLVAGTSAAALSNIRARDATNNPRYDIIDGTPSNCVWWWNSDDGLSCSLMLMVVGVSEDDFVSWNPSITADCGNYEPDHSYCIKVDASQPPPPTPTDDDGPTEPTDTDPEPEPTNPGNGIETPSPTQPGMVDDCDEFHFVEKGENCEDITNQWGITIEEFVAWNTDIGGVGCGGLWGEVNVCVSVIGHESEPSPTDPDNGIETPSPAQPGMVDNCDEFHQVGKGESCDSITEEYNISIDQFTTWNSDIGGTACNGMWADAYVCVSIVGHESEPSPTDPGNGIETPSPAQPGMVDNCDEFHQVAKGESCDSITEEYNISIDQFTTWNSEIGGTACNGMWANAYVCVSIIGHTPSEPSPTDPGNGIETPSPVRENMVDNCDDFHFVESGDNCETIADEANISIDLFYRWNPDAGNSCGGLWRNTYVCISTTNHTPTPTNPGNGISTPEPIQEGMTKNCDRFHFVEQGDLCVDLADQYNIRVSDIIRWNPAAGSECRGLWGNTYACVGVL